MILEMPQQYRFDCPEGNYRAFLHSIDRVENKRKPTEILTRFRFEIPALSTEDHIMLVAKNYKPTELKRDLESWLGLQFIKQHKKGRGFDLDILLRKPGDIVVVNHHNPNFEEPFVTYGHVYSPGTLLPPVMPIHAVEAI